MRTWKHLVVLVTANITNLFLYISVYISGPTALWPHPLWEITSLQLWVSCVS